jgi:hypothetical protein
LIEPFSLACGLTGKDGGDNRSREQMDRDQPNLARHVVAGCRGCQARQCRERDRDLDEAAAWAGAAPAEDSEEQSAEQRPRDRELREPGQRDPPASGKMHAGGAHRHRRNRGRGGSHGGYDDCRAPQRRGRCTDNGCRHCSRSFR